MKILIYLFVSVFMSGSINTSADITQFQKEESIEFICSSPRYSRFEFAKAEMIIKKRLENYGFRNFAFESDNVQGSIKIMGINAESLSIVEQLACTKGELAFYDTRDRATALKTIDADDFLYTIMILPRKKKNINNLSSNAVFGYSRGDNRFEVEEYLKYKATGGLSFPDIKFAWNKVPLENGNYELYLLEQNSILSNKNVKEVSSSINENGGRDILLSFDEEGSDIWARQTEESIGRAIAILIDDQVYAAPIVKEIIENGRCKISGTFSETETKLLTSILASEVLTLEFQTKQQAGG
jgi:hypothetical protein